MKRISLLLLFAVLNLSSARAQDAPVSIVSPSRGALVNDLHRASGTFERGSGASSVVRIEVLYKRAADGALWNGASWGRALSWLPAQLSFSAGRWSFSGGPPQSTLSEGAFYFLYARAIPSAGKPSFIANSFVRVDVTGPSLSIATFADGAVVFSLRTIGGTAYDKADVRDTQVGIRREADAKFWNGTSWIAGVQLRGAEQVGSIQSVKWQLSDGPGASALAPGEYTILAYAADALNNRATAFVTVRVSPPATTPTATPTVAPAPTPTATPDVGKIVFVSGRNGGLNVHILSPDGTG